MTMELKPYPKGLLRTIAYTQLSDAIKKDFGIELPRETGNEIPKVIDDILGVRATDPLLKEMVEALDKAIRSVSELIGYSRGVEGLHLNGDIAEWDSLRTGGNNEGWLIEFDEAASVLQKYKEQYETNTK